MRYIASQEHDVADDAQRTTQRDEDVTTIVFPAEVAEENDEEPADDVWRH